METIYLAILGVFLGVLYRTVKPYLIKKREAKALPFDMTYLYTAVGTLATCLSITLLIFPAFKIPDIHPIYVLCSSFTFGYTANDVVNEGT